MYKPLTEKELNAVGNALFTELYPPDFRQAVLQTLANSHAIKAAFKGNLVSYWDVTLQGRGHPFHQAAWEIFRDAINWVKVREQVEIFYRYYRPYQAKPERVAEVAHGV